MFADDNGNKILVEINFTFQNELRIIIIIIIKILLLNYCSATLWWIKMLLQLHCFLYE